MNATELAALYQRRSATESQINTLRGELVALDDLIEYTRRALYHQSYTTLCKIHYKYTDNDIEDHDDPEAFGSPWLILQPVTYGEIYPVDASTYIATHRTIWYPALLDSAESFWYNPSTRESVWYNTATCAFERYTLIDWKGVAK